MTPILPKPLTYLRCRLGRLYCPKTYAHFASYASQILPPITHNQGVHDHDIFISGGIFEAARLSIILNTLSSPLLPIFSLPIFLLSYKKENPTQGFSWSLHEFPWEAFLSYRVHNVLDNCSDFNFHLIQAG